MIRIRRAGRFLNADDLSEGRFRGRPMEGWAENEPVGEWVRIYPPEDPTA